MSYKIPNRRILSEQPKEELIDRIMSLSKKRTKHTIKIHQLESIISQKNKKILWLEEELKERDKEFKLLKDNKKEVKMIRHYEDLLRDYRFEVSDLKDEIEEWRKRFINK